MPYYGFTLLVQIVDIAPLIAHEIPSVILRRSDSVTLWFPPSVTLNSPTDSLADVNVVEGFDRLVQLVIVSFHIYYKTNE